MMNSKRFFAKRTGIRVLMMLAIILALAAPSVGVLAEASEYDSAGVTETPHYDDVILFRDLPWFTDVEAYVDSLTEDLIDSDTTRRTMRVLSIHASEITNYINPQSLDREYIIFDNREILFSFRFPVAQSDVSVGEYPVLSVSGFALPKVDGNLVYEDSSVSQTVYAEYIFDTDQIDDTAAAARDLKVKLSYLYGEPARERTDNLQYYALWLGQENTYVALEYQQSTPSIYIAYGIQNIPEMVAEIEEIHADATAGL